MWDDSSCLSSSSPVAEIFSSVFTTGIQVVGVGVGVGTDSGSGDVPSIGARAFKADPLSFSASSAAFLFNEGGGGGDVGSFCSSCRCS